MHIGAMKKYFWVLLGIVLTVKSLNGQTPEEVRSALKEWVDVKKITSEEASEWKVEKAVIEDMLQVLEQEEVDLKQKIEDSQSFLSTADEKRSTLEDERAELVTASGELTEFLDHLEQSVKTLYAKFPEPLQETLEPLYSRIPGDDDAKKPALALRLQSVIGILSQADKFNSNLSLEIEIRQIEGSTVEVKTLYFGLAGAVYAEANGGSGGYGLPAADGWTWIDAPEDLSGIIETIQVYEGSKEATFTNIPVKLN